MVLLWYCLRLRPTYCCCGAYFEVNYFLVVVVLLHPKGHISPCFANFYLLGSTEVHSASRLLDEVGSERQARSLLCACWAGMGAGRTETHTSWTVFLSHPAISLHLWKSLTLTFMVLLIFISQALIADFPAVFFSRALSWNTAGLGNCKKGSVKFLSSYFRQKWAFWTIFCRLSMSSE